MLKCLFKKIRGSSSRSLHIVQPKFYRGMLHLIINLWWILGISHLSILLIFTIFSHEEFINEDLLTINYLGKEFNKRGLFFTLSITYASITFLHLLLFIGVIVSYYKNSNRKLNTFFEKKQFISTLSLGIIFSLAIMTGSYPSSKSLFELENKTISSMDRIVLNNAVLFDGYLNNLQIQQLSQYTNKDFKSGTLTHRIDSSNPDFVSMLISERTTKQPIEHSIIDWDLNRDGNIKGGILPPANFISKDELKESKLILAYLKKTDFSKSKDLFVSALITEKSLSNCYITKYKINYSNKEPSDYGMSDNCVDEIIRGDTEKLSSLRILNTLDSRFPIESIEVWIVEDKSFNQNLDRNILFNSIKSIKVFESMPEGIFKMSFCANTKYPRIEGEESSVSVKNITKKGFIVGDVGETSNSSCPELYPVG